MHSLLCSADFVQRVPPLLRCRVSPIIRQTCWTDDGEGQPGAWGARVVRGHFLSEPACEAPFLDFEPGGALASLQGQALPACEAPFLAMSASTEVVLWSDGAGSVEEHHDGMNEYAFRCAVNITLLIGLATIIVRFYTIARLCVLKLCGCCCSSRHVGGTVRRRGSPGVVARAAGQAANSTWGR